MEYWTLTGTYNTAMYRKMRQQRDRGSDCSQDKGGEHRHAENSSSCGWASVGALNLEPAQVRLSRFRRSPVANDKSGRPAAGVNEGCQEKEASQKVMLTEISSSSQKSASLTLPPQGKRGKGRSMEETQPAWIDLARLQSFPRLSSSNYQEHN